MTRGVEYDDSAKDVVMGMKGETYEVKGIAIADRISISAAETLS